MLEINPIVNALLRSKVGAILLVLQITITLAIVSNAVFMIETKLAFLSQESGIDEQGVIVLESRIFDKKTDYIQQSELDERLLRDIPGVIDAIAISSLPVSGSGSSSSFTLKPAPEQSKGQSASYFFADEHLVNALGVKLIAGRNFTEQDVIMSANRDKLPNGVLVTQALVSELFPESDGIGKVIHWGDKPFTIIGVIEHLKGREMRTDHVVLIPFIASKARWHFMIRTEPEQRKEIIQQVEATLLKANNKRVLFGTKGMDDVKANHVAGDTLMMRMLLVLIIVLVLVTALGIFGLTLFNISKRTKQIGTRRALGARKSAIIRYFLVENTLVCAIGLILGTIGAVFMGQQLMRLYSLPALPVHYIAGTALGILFMSLLAVFGPAKKAADISPSIATRTV